MKLHPEFLRYQGPMLKALGRAAVSSLRGPKQGADFHAPGEWLTEAVMPPPGKLVDAYAEWAGAPAGKYGAGVPPHLFPQWGFPLLSRTLEGLPYKLSAVLNQGCRLEVKGEIPRGVPLKLRGRLEALDADGNKARIHQRLITGTAENPELLVSDVFAVIVLKKSKGEPRAEDTNVYKPVGSFRAERIDGLRFGILTGDMNPLHWVPPYAKMAGFKNEILHGFGTFARTWELLAQQVGHGRIGLIDVRFIRPLVLPATADVEVTEGTGERRLRVTDGKTIFAAGTFRV